MDNAHLAVSPQHSATVMASAGTGKTWLLVSRLLRLLLEGTVPDAILAVTFTRKAAAEMSARLSERLYALARMDHAARAQALREAGIEPTAALLYSAATLYEKRLLEPCQVRVTTFHAFCQELLRRFPLEADVPAGFELLDGSRLLQEAAWDALVDEVTRLPNSAVAQALEHLFQQLNDHQETKKALMRFLHHRSDWWAYTLDSDDPVEFARRNLALQLAIDTERDPLAEGLTPAACAELREYAQLLRRHGTATFTDKATALDQALSDPKADAKERLNALSHGLLRKDGLPLAHKPSKALEKSLGEDGQQRFLALYQRLAEWIMAIRDQHRRRCTWSLSSAWFMAGAHLLDQYQRLKGEQRVLDFNDLEWKAYVLLNRADHALWVQYKLDQRIDHLLIDEFQDTNPTQWHLIFPLLQELAAGGEQRRRSVFLVGDAKQSIYRFRRAEPGLFPAARQWLNEKLHAVDHALTASWRSAPAVIEFVNRIFADGPLREQLPEFSLHDTRHPTLWGRVELMPLIAADDREPPPAAGMRNPLRQPRTPVYDQRHSQEGDAIAARIHALVAAQTLIGQGANAHPIGYDDVMILVRNRTHVHAYEEALRASGIPYITASRGTLLDCIEIRDMVALLEILIAPYNNLTLATVLRSPLFNCSDTDLMALAAEPGGNWLERLLALAPRQERGSPLVRAAHWLVRWRDMAGQRPVHDLLDRIYSEGNVVTRYQAAFPAHLRPRVRANLTRFIGLALEMDSGRYPSLTAFLARLHTLKILEEDAPDESAESAAAGNVRLLTIHGAKGLEAPVVFLADAAVATPVSRAYQAMVHWPADAEQPSHFLLCGKSTEADTVTAALVDDEARQQRREQANLLYVALTRAKQILVISGCRARRDTDLGWYGAIAGQLGDTVSISQNGWRASSGEPPPPVPPAAVTATASAIDKRLALPVPLTALDVEIAPSRSSGGESGDIEAGEDSRERGLAIHRFLQLLTSDPKTEPARMPGLVAAALNLDQDTLPIKQWLTEAERIVNDPALRPWFDPAYYDYAFNEVPLYYYSGERLVHGVLDRLVVKGDTCLLIDYKTHRNATEDRLSEMAFPYSEQLRRYAEGVRLLWPGKAIRAYLLFTACAGIHEWREVP